MTGLDYEVLDDPVQNYLRIFVIHRRTGAPECDLLRAVRAPAAMWNLRLAESVGDGATDTVVVTLEMSTPQARRRKKVESVEINDVGTTPKRARLKVLADIFRHRAMKAPSPCCRKTTVSKD
jgi:hypothetical protein